MNFINWGGTKRLQSTTKVLGTPESDSMKMHWQAILETISNDITGIGNPLSPDNVGEFITINNIESGGEGWTDKFHRQMLPKWASVPRLLSGEFITINNIESGGEGWTDKFHRQMLQKWASVPRLLSGIVVLKIYMSISCPGLFPWRWKREKSWERVCIHVLKS